MGYDLSRSGLYLCLLPHCGNTSEKKRYVSTVPVQLSCPEISLRKKNIDRMFAKWFIKDMFEVSRLFGPNAVLFMSNDDKVQPTSNCCWYISSMKWNCWIMIFSLDHNTNWSQQIMGYAKLLTLVMYRKVKTTLLG